MPCETLTNEKGELTAIVCSAPWGMGVTDYGQFDSDDGTEDDEFRYIYGFGGSGDPHCFEPDYELNTPEEIKNWEAAKAACNCGRDSQIKEIN